MVWFYAAVITFNIFSNGLNDKKLNLNTNNVTFTLSENRRNVGRIFMPTLTAPIDIIKKNDKLIYWEIAKKQCHMWKSCGSIIYDNKAYACEPAAAFDRMSFKSDNWSKSFGWDIKKTPFKKTPSEIRNQLTNFCYRCGWCLNQCKKNANLQANATPTNFKLIHKPKTFL